MKRTPLTRKTPLARVGKKKLAQGSTRWNGAMGPRVTPRKRMKSKPLKRSKEWLAYKAANTECELIGMFPSWHEVFDYPEYMWEDDRDEIHHIMQGQSGKRHDIPTNMIRLCKPVHDWIHFRDGGHQHEGRALCLIRKAEKGELSWSELHRITGKQMPGWCDADSRQPREVWIQKLWQKLIASGSGSN